MNTIRAWLLNRLTDQLSKQTRFGKVTPRPDDWEGWVAVRDAMPSVGQDVLIALSDETGYYNIAVASWWGDLWLYPNTTPGFPRDVVAYWAYVPEPPND